MNCTNAGVLLHWEALIPGFACFASELSWDRGGLMSLSSSRHREKWMSWERVKLGKSRDGVFL